MLSAVLNWLRKADDDRTYRKVRLLLTRPLGARGKRYLSVLFAGLLAIVLWQGAFASPRSKVDDSYKITAASGVHHDKLFTYFFYYLNLFPVVDGSTLNCARDARADIPGAPAEFSYDGAQRALSTRGRSLQQDACWTWYSGDRGKIFLYLFDAWIKGAPWNPSPTPASRVGFIIALGVLYAAAWWIRRPLVGAALVTFLGSNPFQLFEINGRPNVFSWNITTAILLLGLHLPLMQRWYRPDKRWVFLWPIGVGVLMASLRTIRSEPMPMLLGAAATYALIVGFTWRRRAALVATLAVSFWFAGALWGRYFVDMQRRSAEVVAAHGGHPYPADVRLYHHVWHPIWCGLGDFGQKYGYEWDDTRAAAYAKPILVSKGVYVPTPSFTPSTDPREYLDPETKLYKTLPYDVPFYNDVIRDKVLSDIKRDPLWYAGVLMKRVHRIFTMTTPVRVTMPSGWFTIPWHGVVFFPLVALFALLRSRLLVGISLFTLPSVTTALVIYSDRGITYYGIFHIVTFALVIGALLCHAHFWAGRALERYEAKRARA